jgi:hypothetical protein
MPAVVFTPKASWKEVQCPVPYCRAFRWGELSVIVGEEPGIGWHLSVAHPRRYPTWDEIKAARYDHVPDAVTMVMCLPPREEYVNVHRNCFHLHEAPGDWAVLR